MIDEGNNRKILGKCPPLLFEQESPQFGDGGLCGIEDTEEGRCQDFGGCLFVGGFPTYLVRVLYCKLGVIFPEWGMNPDPISS